VVEAVAGLAASMPVGDPSDPATRIGPLVSARQRDRVEGYVAAALAEGARVVTGGRRPVHLERGWFIEPTVLADVDPAATVAREEVFGPVLAVLAYDTVDDAVSSPTTPSTAWAERSGPADEERGIQLARRVESGSVGVNFYNLDLGSPFGGVKASGLGRELGPEGLEAYVAYKSIYTRG
jgi:acyl-CoA reductase-like NAD-dependent aldehyde dehydrogenase